MTNPIEISNVEAMAHPNRQASSETLPGTDVLGAGVDVFGEYTGASSLRHQIIDLGEASKRDPQSGKLTSEHVTVRAAKEGMAESIEGSTLSEVASTLASSVKLEGSSGFFKGEMSASYNTSTSHKVSTRYIQYSEKHYRWQLLLPSFTELRDLIPEKTKENFESASNMSPAELIETYGTHYVSSLIVGARLSYCCAIDSSEYTSEVSIAAAAKASYNGLVGKGSGSGDAKVDNAAKQINENAMRKARVLGGDSNFVDSVLNGNYDPWRKSIDDNMHVVDLYNGMTEISKLITDPKRREAVAAEIKRVLSDAKGPADPYLYEVQPFHNPSTGTWFFSANQDDIPTGFGPHPYAGSSFFAYKEQINGSIPIYRLRANNPLRFMLSADPTERAGWTQPELAFYAYLKKRGDRVLLNGFNHKKHPGNYGWFYNTNASVGGWVKNESNSFYAPKG